MADANKWALLVGINNYKLPQVRLRGPVNDVRLIAELLQSGFGFPADHIQILLDSAATRDGLLKAAKALGKRVQDEDAVVFFFSGQGSMIPDPSGRWSGGKISTLVLYDYEQEADSVGQISYDELCEWFLQRMIARPYLTLIFDTNHAGTLGPCLEADQRLRERTVFLGACRANESAYDANMEGVYHGAFTYALSQALVEAGPKTTYRQLFTQVSNQVLARYPQHPQMEGKGDGLLFGSGKVESMRFISVVGRTQNMVILGAGAAFGMTAGSTWSIYASDTLQVSADTPKRGSVEITTVSAVSSEAKILSEAGAKAITAGTRAIEDYHNYGEMRLNVVFHIPSDEFQNLSDRLYKLFMDSQLINVVAPDAQANVTIWLVQPRSIVKVGDPVPQMGGVDEATWALVDDSGYLLKPTYSVKDQKAVWEMRDSLERLARVRNVLNLRNPNLNNPLAGKVDFTLERQRVDGTWKKAQPETKSGMIQLEEGDEIRFVITNHFKTPLYVSILDFPWQGSFSLIFPIQGGSEKIEPRKSVETLALQVFIPEDRSASTAGGDEPRVVRIETAKLFATAYPTDFRALVRQEGYRDLESNIGGTTMLWELLDMALTGYGSRRSLPVQLPVEQEWITVECSFAVQRQPGGKHG
jgi:hypothetical protein